MGDTTFTIGLPLSLDVAAALMRAVGTMWPEATVTQGMTGMTFNIPNRAPKRVSKKSLIEVLPEMVDSEGDPDLILESWRDGTIEISQDSFSEAQQRLAAIALIMLRSMDAPNFVEQEVVATEPDGTSRRFHFAVAWSKGQSPAERLRKAERELEARND